MQHQVPSGKPYWHQGEVPTFTHNEVFGDDFDKQVEVAQPLVVEQQSERSNFERYLDVVKNVFVIVTCCAVLYSLLEVYFFIGRLQVALQDFANYLNTVNLGG